MAIQSIEELEKRIQSFLELDVNQLDELTQQLRAISTFDPDESSRDRARVLLEELIGKFPQVQVHSQETVALMDKAEGAFYAGKIKESIQLYEQVLKIEPEWDRAKEHYKTAKEYLISGEIPKIALPIDAGIEFGKAQSVFRLGDFETAHKYMCTALNHVYEAGFEEWKEGEAFLKEIDNAIHNQSEFKNIHILIDNGRWGEAFRAINNLRMELLTTNQRDIIERFKDNYSWFEHIRKQISEAHERLAEISINELNTIEERTKGLIQLYPQNEPLIAFLKEIKEIRSRKNTYELYLQKARTEIESTRFSQALEYLLSAREIVVFSSSELDSLLLIAQTNLSLQEKYYELMGRGRHYMDIEDYRSAMKAFDEADEIINGPRSVLLPDREEPKEMIGNGDVDNE